MYEYNYTVLFVYLTYKLSKFIWLNALVTYPYIHCNSCTCTINVKVVLFYKNVSLKLGAY